MEEPGTSGTLVSTSLSGPAGLGYLGYPHLLGHVHGSEATAQGQRDITNDPPPMYFPCPMEGNMFTRKAIIIGPANNLYEEGVFCLKIQFPSNNLFRPPNIYFTTSIYHPNINQRGYICLDSFRSQLSPIMTLSKLLLFISSMLCDPNPNEAFILSILRMYLEDRVAYDSMARAWTRKYAM